MSTGIPQTAYLELSSKMVSQHLGLIKASTNSSIPLGFIGLGYKLFLDADSPLAPPFVVGDIFSKDCLDPSASPSSPVPTLKSLVSLTPLRASVRTLHAGSFFHLFDQETQLQLAHLVKSLIRPASGSTIFGSHVGQAKMGLRSEARPEGEAADKTNSMFCHSPECVVHSIPLSSNGETRLIFFWFARVARGGKCGRTSTERTRLSCRRNLWMVEWRALRLSAPAMEETRSRSSGVSLLSERCNIRQVTSLRLRG